nr:hypothetical protein [Candidatus Cloacimonadota bacterium]
PLPKGKARGMALVSSSYSYAPALNFEPDSTLGFDPGVLYHQKVLSLYKESPKFANGDHLDKRG